MSGKIKIGSHSFTDRGLTQVRLTQYHTPFRCWRGCEQLQHLKLFRCHKNSCRHYRSKESGGGVFKVLFCSGTARILSGHTIRMSKIHLFSSNVCHQRIKQRPRFPSPCYFETQPTGRGTRMEVGNRPWSGVRGLSGNNWECQSTTTEGNSASWRPFTSQ